VRAEGERLSSSCCLGLDVFASMESGWLVILVVVEERRLCKVNEAHQEIVGFLRSVGSFNTGTGTTGLTMIVWFHAVPVEAFRRLPFRMTFCGEDLWHEIWRLGKIRDKYLSHRHILNTHCVFSRSLFPKTLIVASIGPIKLSTGMVWNISLRFVVGFSILFWHHRIGAVCTGREVVHKSKTTNDASHVSRSHAFLPVH
jgi:hypothetical protein